MNTTMVIGVIVVLIVVAAGAALVMNHGGSEGTQTQTTTTTEGGGGATQTTTTSQGGGGSTETTTQTSSGGSELDISGTWRGTYTCKYGTGHWEWIIKKTPQGNYVGALKVMDYYESNGYLDIQVTLDGNKIKVGTIGNTGLPAAVFSGTVSPDGKHASGTWKFSNNMDGGEWQGEKVSDSTVIPTETTTTTEGGGGATQTTTTSQGGGGSTETTQTGGPSSNLCTPNPPDEFKEAFESVQNALYEVFGESNVICYEDGILGQYPIIQYHANYDLQGINTEDVRIYATPIANALESEGWINVTVMTMTTDSLVVAGLRPATIMGQPAAVMLQVSILVNPDGTVDLTVLIQPTLS